VALAACALAEVPDNKLAALMERAVSSGYDFIDFWAVDFDWQPGQPFHHDWQDYRTRKDRSLCLVLSRTITENYILSFSLQYDNICAVFPLDYMMMGMSIHLRTYYHAR